MDESKKSKWKVRKEDRKENLETRSLQNVGTYQRMYRVSYSAFILIFKAARNSPTQLSKVFLKDLLLLQLVKKHPAFYGIRWPLPCSKTSHHLPLSWITLIQSTPTRSISLGSILILSPNLCLYLPSGFFLSAVPTKLFSYVCQPVRH